MRLAVERYTQQREMWPSAGRHVLAQFDEASVIVYQAYRPEIGLDAATRGRFGGSFSLSRMSWVKPNFLWTMFRSGWGTKPGQEVTLAIHLCRDAFDEILRQAVPSTHSESSGETVAEWKQSLLRSDVRMQWDPDHDPSGRREARRAIQVGLRGAALRAYAREWILEIEDVSGFVAEQRLHASETGWPNLVVPREEVYSVNSLEVARRLGLGQVNE